MVTKCDAHVAPLIAQDRLKRTDVFSEFNFLVTEKNIQSICSIRQNSYDSLRMHLFLGSDPTSCFSPCSLGSMEPNHTCLSENMSGGAQPWIVMQVNPSKEHADVLLFCTLAGWISSHHKKRKRRDLYSQAGFQQPSRWPSQPFLSEGGGTYQRDTFSPKWGSLAGSADNKHPISTFTHYCGTSVLWLLQLQLWLSRLFMIQRVGPRNWNWGPIRAWVFNNNDTYYL